MSSVEEFCEKEKEYAYYDLFFSNIKRDVKESLKGLINSAVDDCVKKMSGKFSPEVVNQSLQKCRKSYMSALENNSSKIEVAIDEALKLPESFDGARSNVDEEKMNHEINSLKLKLLALNKYRTELLKAEEILEDKVLDFSDQSDLLMKMQASSSQLHSEVSLMADLFNKRSSCGTTDLENSVMNMSIE